MATNPELSPMRLAPRLGAVLVFINLFIGQPQGLGIKTIEYPKETVGAVAGVVVRNGTDEVLSGVRIQVRSVGGGKIIASAVSDGSGRFHIRLTRGEYRLRFFLLGYDIVQMQVTNTGKGEPKLRVELPMGT